MEKSVEITKEAATLLIGNDEISWVDFKQMELAEVSYYINHGVKIAAIHNYVANVTQYYIQDINY
jgi:hypothetical protein